MNPDETPEAPDMAPKITGGNSTPKRPAPVRSYSLTTFSWSMSKRLKAEVFVLADMSRRTASNWITLQLAPITETMLARYPVTLTDGMILKALKEPTVNT
jgi:hypothetical protein